MYRSVLPFAVALVLLPTAASAQNDHAAADSAAEHGGHIAPFTEGRHGGWLFGAPHLDANAGLYHTDGDGAGNVDDLFLRLHLQYAPGATGAVELAINLLFLPAEGATPTVTGVVQFAPLPERSRFYVNAGIGAITGRNPNGDRLNGWLEATAAWRAPLHDITPFVQVGHATGSGHHFEFLFGIAHPIAPYHAPSHHG